MRPLSAWLGFSWVLFTAPAAWGDEEPWRVARAHYARGVELANKAAYRAALDEFNAAYAKSPHFAVLYNIGQAEIALGRPLKAIETLNRYLRDGKEDVPVERRRQVEQQIAELKSAFGALMVKTNPPGATISIDGAQVGNAPLAEPLILTPGSHVVTASRSNALPVTRVITVKEGEHQELEMPVPLAQGGLLSIQCWELGAQPYLDGKAVELSKAFAGVPVSEGRHTVSFVAPGRVWQEQFVEVPPGVHAAVLCGTVPAEAGQSPQGPPPERETKGFSGGTVLVGAGVMMGGVALGHYLWNLGRYRDWQSEQKSINEDDSSAHYDRQVKNNELAESIDGASKVSVGLTITAGALVAGGVTWLLLDHSGTAATAPKSQAANPFPLGVGIGREGAALSWRGAW